MKNKYEPENKWPIVIVALATLVTLACVFTIHY